MSTKRPREPIAQVNISGRRVSIFPPTFEFQKKLSGFQIDILDPFPWPTSLRLGSSGQVHECRGPFWPNLIRWSAIWAVITDCSDYISVFEPKVFRIGLGFGDQPAFAVREFEFGERGYVPIRLAWKIIETWDLDYYWNAYWHGFIKECLVRVFGSLLKDDLLNERIRIPDERIRESIIKSGREAAAYNPPSDATVDAKPPSDDPPKSPGENADRPQGAATTVSGRTAQPSQDQRSSDGPIDPLKKTLQLLSDSRASQRLIRYLAEEASQRRASLDDIAVGLNLARPATAASKRKTLRQRFNRARKQLELLDAPLRLAIEKNIIELMDKMASDNAT